MLEKGRKLAKNYKNRGFGELWRRKYDRCLGPKTKGRIRPPIVENLVPKNRKLTGAMLDRILPLKWSKFGVFKCYYLVQVCFFYKTPIVKKHYKDRGFSPFF